MVLGAGAVLVAAYFTFGSWLARRVFRLDDANITPAVAIDDGADFVPTKKSIIFGHHFTSIAGTGPIVGPAIAVMWGWLPALLWVVFGSIFIGAVHDLGAIVVSLRKKGRSIGDIAGDLLGPRARIIFLGILVMGLWLVLAVFGLVIASVLRQYPAAIFPVVAQTPLAMIVGWLLYKRKLSIALPSVIALGVMYASVVWGDVLGIHTFNAWMAGLPRWVWVVGLLGYAYIASVIPVWVLLQPRDYINALQLVTALALLVVGLGAAALVYTGGEASGIGHQASGGDEASGIGHQASAGEAPESAMASAASPLGGEVDASMRASGEGYSPSLSLVAPMIDWHPPGAPPMLPVLFITVACGACSGFHCLVGSGTTSKQIAKERDAKAVGYGSMVTEGFLAVIVIAACAGGIGLGVQAQVVQHPSVSVVREQPAGSTVYAERMARYYRVPDFEGRLWYVAVGGTTFESRSGVGTPHWFEVHSSVAIGFSHAHVAHAVGSGDPSFDPGPRESWESDAVIWDSSLHSLDSLPSFVRDSIRITNGGRSFELVGSAAFLEQYKHWQSAGSLASTVGAFVEGGANFLAALNIPRHIAIALMAVMVASFAATTMDTSCRLQRYVVQELGRVVLVGRKSKHKTGSCPGCGYDLEGIDPERAVTHDASEAHTRCPECNTVSTVEQRASEGVVTAAIARAAWWNPIKWLTTTHGATMFAVLTACALAFIPPAGQAWSLSNAGMGAMTLWPLFGCVNQLLAGFAFVVIIAWLRVTGRPWWFGALPALIMLVMPAWALVWQAFIGDANSASWMSAHKWPLVATGAIALALEVWLVAEALVRWPKSLAASPLGGEAGSSGASAG